MIAFLSITSLRSECEVGREVDVGLVEHGVIDVGHIQRKCPAALEADIVGVLQLDVAYRETVFVAVVARLVERAAKCERDPVAAQEVVVGAHLKICRVRLLLLTLVGEVFVSAVEEVAQGCP